MPNTMLRNISYEALEKAKLNAHARGMSLGEYITKLVALHDAARAHADAGNDTLQVELMALGLETVRR